MPHFFIIFSSDQDSESVGRCVGCGRTLLGLRTIQRSQPGSGQGTQDKDAREYLLSKVVLSVKFRNIYSYPKKIEIKIFLCS